MKRYLQKIKRHISPLLMVVGSLAGVVYFYIIPLFSNFRECFTEGVNQKTWVGLKNFTDLLSNKAFLLAVRNTARFYAVSFPLLMILPLLLALSVVRAGRSASKKNRVSAWFSRLFSRCSVIFTFPIVIPLVSMMMVLDTVFGYEGLLNLCLKSAGLAPLDAYTSSFSFVYLVVVFVIRYSGYNFLLYLAGRVRIQKIYYETAQLDGASDARCFFHITLPLMVPTMFLCLVVTLVNSYKLFREAYMIGGSYPHESIYMIQHFINNNLHALNYHRLAAASVLILIVTLVVIFLLFLFQRRVEVNE